MSDIQNASSISGLGNYGGNASIFGANQLPDILGLVQSKLQQSAASYDLFTQVFGDKANTAEIQAVRSQWSVGDFSQLPSVQILAAANFNNAVGAYASSSQTVYLSDALLQDGAAPLDSFLGAAGILVEETFQWLDSLVGSDTQGDEGELARLLVFGESVSNTELNRIKQEDDRGFITVDGQSVFVEQAGTNVTVEATGNAKLLKDESKLLSAQVGSNAAVAIKYNGSQIYTGIFAGWETVAVETVGGQNQVLWKNTASNSTVVWNMDSNWNYLSSGSVFALNSGGALTQETNFGVDINGDSFVGGVNLEWKGSTKLVKDAANSLYAQLGNNTPISIKYNGSQISTTIFAGWETVAVEAVYGQNQVLWKNAGTNSAVVWNMDSNWNYSYSGSVLSLNSTAAITQESNFNFDLNGNGYIGSANITVESQGNTKLLKDGANLLSAQLGSNAAVAIKYNGSQIYTNIFAGWETVAVETVYGQNQVLWKNAGTNSAVVWNLDSNWNYAYSGSLLTLNSSGAFTQETNFNIDFNTDGYVGTPGNYIAYKIIEGGGNTSLIKNPSGLLSAQVGGNQFAIKYGGSQIYTGIFAGWETLAVETVAGQNQVLWRNTASNSAVVWNMDSNWNYLSSGSVFSLNSVAALAQELNFGPGTFSDLNGDGSWGIFTSANSFTPVTTESFGTTKLLKDQYTFLSAQVGSNAAVAIKYNGSQIYTGIFAGWETVAVETVGGQNQVLWKNIASNSAVVWNMDSNWSYLSSGSVFTLNSGGALTQETNFGVDINGDSFVGGVNLEWKGSTKLVKDAANSLYAQLGNNTPVSVKYNGSQIYTNIFAGWETVAVETVGGQNQVLWKNAGTNSAVVWNMDSNWNYSYSGSVLSLNSTAAITEESNFNFDLNGDGVAGNAISVVAVAATDSVSAETISGQIINNGTFTLTRTGTNTAISVNYTLSGTAVNGIDYISLNGVANFAAGAATAIVSVSPIDDALFEGTESVILTLASGSGYTLGSLNNSNVTISDNDLAPFVTVTSPNGGNSLQRGQAVTIQWNDNIADNVRLDLYKNNIFYRNITTSTLSNGSFAWTVPNDVLLGTDYKIRVAKPDNTLIDFSDNNFSIAGTPNIDLKGYSLVSPVTAAAGSTQNINYNIQNAGVDPSGAFRVSFYLSSDTIFTTGDRFLGSANIASLAGGGLSGNVSRSITLPNPRDSFYSGDKPYYIGMIVDDLNAVAETNEGNNSGQRVGDDYAAVTVSGTVAPFVTVTSPNGGQSLQAGSSYNITWTDNISENVKVDLFKAGVFAQTIFSSTLSDGSESWVVPTNLAAGSDYQIKVSSVDNANLGDLSNNTFTVVPVPTSWVKQIASPSSDYLGGIAVDSNGSINISGNGSTGGFLANFDVSGSNTWLEQFISGYTTGVATSSSSIYTSGYTDLSNHDASVSKFSGESTLLWSQKLGDATSSEFATAVATDSSGNAYVTGVTYGNVGGTNAGGSDAFVAKYSTSGTLLWTKQLGTTFDDNASGISTDSSGNVYITGSTSGSLGGTNTGSSDAFVAKYNTSGTLLWTKQLGTSANDSANSVVTDASGNVYITGSTNGNLGSTNAGSSDAFVAKYNTLGTLLWTKQLGTSAADSANSIATDISGNVYVTGSTSGNLGGTSAGGSDAFAVKYDAAGTLIWNQHFGDIANDYGEDIAVDNNGNVYIAGTTDGAIIPSLPNQGGSDVFLAKISQGIDGSSAVTVTSPNGGESLQAGNSYSIIWSDNISENVKVDLFKGGVFAQTIFSSTLSDGIEGWAVPSNLASGSDYQIKISSVSNKKIFDFGNSYFTIAPAPFVTVTSPNGGETLQAGGNYTVTWSDNISENVKIDLFKSGVFYQTIFSSTLSDGSEVWTVPTSIASGADYQFKVSSVNNVNLADFSNNYFTVAPFISVTNPNTGTSLQRGQAVTIQWNDNIADNVRLDLYKNNIFYRNITTSTLSNGSFAWTVPNDVLLGADYKIRVAKTDGTLIDFSDNNFSIAGTPNIDLKGYSLVSPVTAAAGSTQNINYNIQNAGIDPSGAFRVSFYLSSDMVFTTGDRFLGSANIASLAGGGLSGNAGLFHSVFWQQI